ncbi:MAG: hypothetical protein HOH95_02800, partial [Dehalococcoidia bacterium]|nr:hypothetical protein [Dehalococcoidia bacterium]
FDFAAAHIPETISIEEGDSMLAYVGWVVPFNQPLVLVTDSTAQADRVATDLLRIGYEEVRGYLPFTKWAADRIPAQLETVDVAEALQIRASGTLPAYDVRFDSDLRTLPLDRSEHRPIDRVQEWLTEVDDDAMLVSCAAGSRAATVASVLQAAGHRPLVLLDGGAADLVSPGVLTA